MHEKCVSYYKFHAFKMIKYTDQSTIENRIFKTPFDNSLDLENRWVIMAKFIPWDKMAKVFYDRLDRYQGRSTVDLRTVLGTMFIQHSMNLTDRDAIQAIRENIYMQYFVGLPSFQTAQVFDHSLLPTLRKRLGKKGAKKLMDIFAAHSIEEQLVKHRKSRSVKSTPDSNDQHDSRTEIESRSQPEDQTQESENRGTVKIDATVIPQNITYPTDTKLLNHSRQLSEQIIDELYLHSPELWETKPRTYRKLARKKWLAFSKTRKPSKKKIKAQIKADLSYLKRNLRYIDEIMALLIQKGIRIKLPNMLRKKMYVISEVYRQQMIMYRDGRKRIEDRIVSIEQPWVRPIVRGKAGRPVEFGAKINISLTENLISVDQSSFDAFNESTWLEDQIESYKDKFGYYPEYALIDKIYLNRANRKYLKSKGIQHLGQALGRPPKTKSKLSNSQVKKRNQRNHVEGVIGLGKLKYGLDNLRTKTKETSYCAIHFIALAMNVLAMTAKANFYACANICSDFYHQLVYLITNDLKNRKPYSYSCVLRS